MAQGWTELHWAAKLRQAAHAEVLSRGCGEEELGRTDEHGRTPLMLLLRQGSSRRGFRELVSILSMKLWAHKDSLGRTSLHYFAAKAKGTTNARAVCEALDLELDSKDTHVLEGDRDGNNALHCVARQNVATSSRHSPFEETAATVVTRFLVERFPGALQSVNNNGHCPLRVLAVAGHRDPLVAAIQCATAEDLLFKDGCGTNFLVSADVDLHLVERALARIPLAVLKQLDPEELTGGMGRGGEPLVLASLTSSDTAICMLEALGDRLSILVNDGWTSLLCHRAAALGKFRIILFLLDNGFSNWDYRRLGYTRNIVAEVFAYKWSSHEEIAAARELFARLPCETLMTSHDHSSVNTLLKNPEIPLDLAELVIARTPEDMFHGQQFADMVRWANERYYSMLWMALPDRCFAEPYALLGLVSSYFVTAPQVEELLQKCVDEALAPVPGEDSVLHWAVVSPITAMPLTKLIFMRAPSLRDYKNAEGLTALEAAHRHHTHHPHGVALYERLEAIICGHYFVKSAVI